MKDDSRSSSIVRAGDRNGFGVVYSADGELLCQSGESILRISNGWDMNVRSPWRRVLPRMIFSGYSGDASSKLYLTTSRIVLIREIDVWRELRGELTPLGLPTAAAKEVELGKLKAAGLRQYCEIWPQRLRVIKAKSYNKGSSWLGLRLLGIDGHQYAITLWKTKGMDEETLSMIESRFRR